jgi:hypothetical protein
MAAMTDRRGFLGGLLAMLFRWPRTSPPRAATEGMTGWTKVTSGSGTVAETFGEQAPLIRNLATGRYLSTRGTWIGTVKPDWIAKH